MTERKAKPEEPKQVTHLPVSGPVLAKAPDAAVSLARANKDRLISLRDELYRESMTVMNHAMRFGDIDPQYAQQKELDPAFAKMARDLGDEDAQKAYRLAQYACLPGADAPVGLKLAAVVAVGIMKANAQEKGGTHVLNVSKVVLSADALPAFEEREVEHE